MVKSQKYDAENLTKMEWLTPTEEHPEGMVWEHCQAMSRSTIKSVMQDRLLELLYRGKMHLFIRLTFSARQRHQYRRVLGYLVCPEAQWTETSIYHLQCHFRQDGKLRQAIQGSK